MKLGVNRTLSQESEFKEKFEAGMKLALADLEDMEEP